MDRSLFDHDIVWAAGGRPDAVFAVSPTDLERVAGAQVADLAVAQVER